MKKTFKNLGLLMVCTAFFLAFSINYNANGYASACAPGYSLANQRTVIQGDHQVYTYCPAEASSANCCVKEAPCP